MKIILFHQAAKGYNMVGKKHTHAHILVNRTGENASYKDQSLYPQAVQCKNNQGGKWERNLIGIENSKWNKKCSESCIKLFLRESLLSNTFTGPLESVQMGTRKKYKLRCMCKKPLLLLLAQLLLRTIIINYLWNDKKPTWVIQTWNFLILRKVLTKEHILNHGKRNTYS